MIQNIEKYLNCKHGDVLLLLLIIAVLCLIAWLCRGYLISNSSVEMERITNHYCAKMAYCTGGEQLLSIKYDYENDIAKYAKKSNYSTWKNIFYCAYNKACK